MAVLETLRRDGLCEEAVSSWIAKWITRGFEAVEALIGDEGWCFGANPTFADLYLACQVSSARRFKVDVEAFSRIQRVDALIARHPAFDAASPENQPDAA